MSTIQEEVGDGDGALVGGGLFVKKNQKQRLETCEKRNNNQNVLRILSYLG
jgi:hypothetical protein